MKKLKRSPENDSSTVAKRNTSLMGKNIWIMHSKSKFVINFPNFSTFMKFNVRLDSI